MQLADLAWECFCNWNRTKWCSRRSFVNATKLSHLIVDIPYPYPMMGCGLCTCTTPTLSQSMMKLLLSGPIIRGVEVCTCTTPAVDLRVGSSSTRPYTPWFFGFNTYIFWNLAALGSSTPYDPYPHLTFFVKLVSCYTRAGFSNLHLGLTEPDQKIVGNGF